MKIEPTEPGQTKGERTARRILDVAEDLFALHGYNGTSLRQIAEGAGIREPGLYNHFSGKKALYEAVLYRALNPMAKVLESHLEQASGLRHYTDLPSIMTDLLLDHPQMAALFQQTMQGDTESVGNKLMLQWLERLFSKGMKSMEDFGSTPQRNAGEQDLATQAINVIALFNLTTGYFLAQRAFNSMAQGDLVAPENIARQKRLLHRVIRAMLIS